MNVALILSGGTGARLGSEIPKQYIKVNKKQIISYCMETLSLHEEIDALHIVADIFCRIVSFRSTGLRSRLSWTGWILP